MPKLTGVLMELPGAHLLSFFYPEPNVLECFFLLTEVLL